jgi:poly(A) polymerase
LLVRYSTSDKGSPSKRAEVFTAKEHGIRRRDIDPDAVRIALRLKSAGHSAYIVGGAVRDLLIKRTPKDFDLVTDAHPRKIKRLFRNSRIIGKRFRLVHVYFREKIIELSTFRALNGGEDDTMYGTIQEDVQRRDFTLNALYYCPAEEIILDYIGGMRDIRKRIVRPLIPLKKIFVEDPVRMIRAVKYSASLGFRLPFFTRFKIRSQAALLGECSTSRLTEELFKIMQSGYSEAIFRNLQNFGLLKYFLPRLSEYITADRFDFKNGFFSTLKALDGSIYESVERHRFVTALAKDYLETLVKERNGEKPLFKDAYHLVKQFLLPLIPANKDVDAAVMAVLRKKKPRLKGPRTGGKPHHPRPAPV